MSTVTLELSELTMNRARQDAVAQNITVEKLLSNSLEPKTVHRGDGKNLIGMFSDIPEVMDDIVEMIYKERERQCARIIDLE